MSDKVSYGSVSLVRQGDYRFYSFTMPSDVLAETCFVVNRDEDPIEGFQRELDKKRAAEIANYIDSGLGTIPSSIVLSAQEDSDFYYDSKRKSVSFLSINKAFLIIDGQHRVYGFKLAKTALRIPVVVYENLSKRDESRLFIDINSKQKGVPTELLLDIKKMAEYENDTEQYLRELFDTFSTENDSVLYNRLSASKREKGKITRSVFNTAVKPLVKVFGNKNSDEIYEIFNSYLIAFNEGVLVPHKLEEQAFNTTVFKAISGFFPIITARVKDRFGAIYSVDNYYEFTEITGQRIKPAKLATPTNAYKPIVDHLEESLKQEFTL
ncbi:DGQHR domain-containing protein [Desulfobotulus mexicanus]|uniref:DGQHR domain-containing protein n=1 Tax=Desulfobotulus mexicanus TaxID=2586642 RepID=A0A5S5MDD6_9BACT|nr:DGQHR domain-containing protein [Desulfobotulus mexicanus]TYT73679.1 DGQHR domain-containing protein [Desulfobotulus mexicanus]